MHPIYAQLDAQIEALKKDGLYKKERFIASPQNAEITVSPHNHVLNFCANNYLGLADHPVLVETAQNAFRECSFLNSYVFYKIFVTI